MNIIIINVIIINFNYLIDANTTADSIFDFTKFLYSQNYKLYVFIIFVLNKNFVKMHAHLKNAII